MSGERERLQLLRETAEEIIAPLPAWDGESPAVLVSVIDPVTRQRLGHWFTPATAAPRPQSKPRPQARPRHLHAVREVS